MLRDGRRAAAGRRRSTTSSWPGALIDMEAGARLSGARFAYLKGDLVLLELALVRWALERAARARLRAGDPAGAGARAGALRDRLPARHRAADLPPRRRRALPRRHLRGRARVAARRRDPRGRRRCRCATPASRRASAARPGAAGKDTRGIFRVHQFDKVEMFVVHDRRARAPPSTSGSSRSRSRCCASSRSPTASSTSPSATSAPRRPRSTTARPGCPSQGRYRELTSCSNTTDFQARRLEIRVRADGRPAAGDRGHAQRHGRRGRAHDHRAAREPPARGPLGRGAGVPGGVRGAGGDRAPLGRLASRRLSRRDASAHAAARGSSITNAAPPPGALAALTRPPCASTIAATIARPRPAPALPRSRPPSRAPEALEDARLRCRPAGPGRGRGPRRARRRRAPDDRQLDRRARRACA